MDSGSSHCVILHIGEHRSSMLHLDPFGPKTDGDPEWTVEDVE